MATCKVSLEKKSAKKAVKFIAKAAVGDAISTFTVHDNEDSSCTTTGVSDAGNPVDISGVATLAVVSADTTKVTVAAPVGMKFQMSAVGPLTTTDVVLTVTATWNDGSRGPFVFDLPVKVVAGPANKIMVVPGVPTPH